MANEFVRNIADADLTKTWALTASDGSVTSGDFDFGALAPGVSLENVELEVTIPSLSGTELASADTLTVLLQHGAAAAPTTSLQISKVLTGTGSTLPETKYRFKLPSDVLRYGNVKITTAGTTGNMSAKSATAKLLF